MALFNQSKGPSRRKNEPTRGYGNRAFGHGKGGRGGQVERLRRTKGSKKASFSSTRTDEKNRNDSNQSDEALETDAELEWGSDGLSSDEEDATAAASAFKPYSALLQSLNDTTERGQPQRKKPKKTEFEVYGNIDSVEDVDLVIEPEEADDLGIAELTDDDGDDEAGKGL